MIRTFVLDTSPLGRISIKTVVAVIMTANLRLGGAPGNVRCGLKDTGLPRQSVVNVSQVVKVDKARFTQRVGSVPTHVLRQVEDGLRRVLGL